MTCAAAVGRDVYHWDRVSNEIREASYVALTRQLAVMAGTMSFAVPATEEGQRAIVKQRLIPLENSMRLPSETCSEGLPVCDYCKGSRADMVCAVCFTKPLCRTCRAMLQSESAWSGWKEMLPFDRCETCGQMVHEICGDTSFDSLAVAGHHSFSCRHCVELKERAAAEKHVEKQSSAQYTVDLSETESEMQGPPEAGRSASSSEPPARMSMVAEERSYAGSEGSVLTEYEC